MSATVPKLRFAGFDGAWKATKLAEKFDHIRNGFVGTATPYYVERGVKYLQGKNIKEGEIDSRGLIHISEQFHKSKRKSALKAGDLLMVQSGHVGECAVVGEGFEGANCHALIILTPRTGVSSEFCKSYFYSPSGLRQINKIKTGNTIEHILASEMAILQMDLPTLPEQQKIAAFLGAVDSKLAALRRKQAGLERFKAGLMQRLFSQKLRFTRDDGSAFPDWQQKRLGDILTVRYGKDHKALSDGDIPVYGTGGIMRKVDQALYHGPSILIGRKGTINKPMLVDGAFWTVDTLFYTEINAAFIPRLVFAVVERVNWLELNEATGVPSLNSNGISSVKVCVPSHPDEQRKIADALTALDAKITATRAQITKTERFKQGLLQQMFV
ncbi:restriction endonuclease subunit S [Pseudorhodobacter sp.]|uniref:restriction endonuclease subunit S n=1 Tax=Pseudorhodobacter sp. TaxID=1934400 RepID=UPI002AFFD032|nr:restriction endonuclease subunit S [Pseudorhodobacter sp.]